MAPNHYVWEHFDIVEASNKPSGHHKARCKHCENTFTIGTSRAKAHHAGYTGAGIAVCKSTPADLRERLQSSIKAATQSKDVTGRLEKLTSSSLASSDLPDLQSSSPAPDNDFHVPHAKKLRQDTIPASFQKNKKEDLDRLVADFFYANGIAFNVARSKYFRAMIKGISEAKQVYTPPTSERLRTDLLEESNKRVVSMHLLCLSVLNII